MVDIVIGIRCEQRIYLELKGIFGEIMIYKKDLQCVSTNRAVKKSTRNIAN